MKKTAIIDGFHRYVLTRQWDNPRLPGTVGWVMLNPSTADAVHDDPTIKRCIGFTERWGYASLRVVNLFSFRTAHPDILKKQPFLQRNTDKSDDHLQAALDECAIIVLAWGAHGSHNLLADRVAEVRCQFLNQLWEHKHTPVFHLGKTKHGQPRHPLMLASDTPLTAYPRRKYWWDDSVVRS